MKIPDEAVKAAEKALEDHQLGNTRVDACDCVRWFGKELNDGGDCGRAHQAQVALEAALEAALPAVKRQITRILDDAVTEFRDSQYRQIEFSPSQCIDFLHGVEAAKRLILEGGSLWRNFEIQRHPLMYIFPHLKEETPWVNQK